LIRLPTAAGSIELTEAQGSGRCSACPRVGGGMARILVKTDAGREAIVRICGTCIAATLAVRVGRRYVDEGGELDDLSREKLEQAEREQREDVDVAQRRLMDELGVIPREAASGPVSVVALPPLGAACPVEGCESALVQDEFHAPAGGGPGTEIGMGDRVAVFCLSGHEFRLRA